MGWECPPLPSIGVISTEVSSLPLSWILPKEGTEGYIEDQTSGKVLAFQENEVILEDKENPISDKQKWNRGISDENGWFSLEKPHTFTPPSKCYLIICQRLWNFMVW